MLRMQKKIFLMDWEYLGRPDDNTSNIVLPWKEYKNYQQRKLQS